MAEVNVTYKTKTETKIVETKEPIFNLELSAEDVIGLLGIVGFIGGRPDNSVRETAGPIWENLKIITFGSSWGGPDIPAGIERTTVASGTPFFETSEVKKLVADLKAKYKG